MIAPAIPRQEDGWNRLVSDSKGVNGPPYEVRIHSRHLVCEDGHHAIP